MTFDLIAQKSQVVSNQYIKLCEACVINIIH